MDCWANIDSFPGGGSYKVLFGYGQFGDSTNGRHTFTAINGGGVTWHIAVDNGGGYGGTAGSMSAGTWYHIAGVFTGMNETGNVKIYLNGDISATNSAPDDDKKYGSKSWWMGKDPAGRFFDGKICAARVWDRALSAAEIASLYRLGRLN
jgi:hypothetical protein